MHDTSGLIQKHASVADFEFEDEASEASGWHFENSVLDNFVDRLNPDGITDKINKIIEDNGISLEQSQEKLYGLAHKFGRRLNRTIESAQERLTDLQEYLGHEGRKVKDRSLMKAVNMITQLGDAAVDVAHKIAAQVEEGQLKVRQMITMLKSERIESRRQEMQQSLDSAVGTLSGLKHALQDAVQFGHGDSDLVQLDSTETVSSDGPDDTISAAIAKAEKMLQQTDELLTGARVYIDFVETRMDIVRNEAARVVELAGNKTDAAFDLSNKIAGDVIIKLGGIDDMLSGKLSVVAAKEIMAKERSAAASTALSVLVGLFVAFSVSQ
jgi:hypothetical protein